MRFLIFPEGTPFTEAQVPFSPLAFMVYISYARMRHKERTDLGWFVSEAP